MPKHRKGSEPVAPMSAREVAELYRVHIATVYRWVDQGAFDVPPTVIPSPSGRRDRLLFDRAAVLKQHEKETKS